MFFLHGKAGRGKTHLIEALINELKRRQPGIIGKIYLSRSNFTHANMSFPEKYNDCPIIIIDDIFVESNNINDLHPRTDIQSLMIFIKMIYEEKRLVIITSNFPILGEMLQKISAVDEIGRTTSRLKELMAYSGELEIIGEDYREIIAKKAKIENLFEI